jgi:hypothetical protein
MVIYDISMAFASIAVIRAAVGGVIAPWMDTVVLYRGYTSATTMKSPDKLVERRARTMLNTDEQFLLLVCIP